MKHKLIYLLVVTIYALGPLITFSQDDGSTANNFKLPEDSYLASNTNLGTEFWFAVPENKALWGSTNIGIKILVTSPKATKVTLEIPGESHILTRNIDAFETTVFSTENNDITHNLEVKESESIVMKAVHIYSDEPVSVCVVNAANASSGGYTALPVSSWGKEYYSCSFYDYNSYYIKNGGGFMVVASEKATKVTINLNGVGKESGKTKGGNEIGDIIRVNLDPGDVYMVKGDGETKGLFDISGSKITASKPIGVISFHPGTTVPSNYYYGWGGDALAEMNLPVQSWGTMHVTVQYPRASGSGYDAEGDFYRVVASEPNTHIHCRYYDMTDQSMIGQLEATIKTPGGFYEYYNSDVNYQNQLKSVRGVVVWTSDKPVMVVQYAYSAFWDWDIDWDANMLALPSVDNFAQSAVFNVADSYNQNELTLFAYGDPGDPESKLLKTIKLDGKQFINVEARLLGNQIPGTNIYWARIFIEPGMHTISSDTKISGFVHGNNMYTSYCHQIILGTNLLNETDEVAPTLDVSESCGYYTVEAFENTNNEPLPEQKDQGISKILMIDELSENFQIVLDNPEKFQPQDFVGSQKFFVVPKDSSLPGHGYFTVFDRAGNYTVDSVIFEPENAGFESDLVDFEKIRVSKTLKKQVTFKNNGSRATEINEVALSNNTCFKIEDLELPMPFPPGSQKTFELEYTPMDETVDDSNCDTLLIGTTCESYSIPLTGQGIMPHIVVDDWDFDSVEVREEICLEEMNNAGLRIENPGTDTLTVTGIDSVKLPFDIKDPDPAFPFKIAPGESVHFKSVCFFPQDTGKFILEAVFLSDGEADKNIAKLEGISFEEDVSVIEEFEKGSGMFEIAPNPASDQFGVLFKTIGNTNVKFRIVDITGIVVRELNSENLSEGMHRINFDTKQIQQGIYFVQLISGQDIYSKRLIIIK